MSHVLAASGLCVLLTACLQSPEPIDDGVVTELLLDAGELPDGFVVDRWAPPPATARLVAPDPDRDPCLERIRTFEAPGAPPVATGSVRIRAAAGGPLFLETVAGFDDADAAWEALREALRSCAGQHRDGDAVHTVTVRDAPWGDEGIVVGLRTEEGGVTLATERSVAMVRVDSVLVLTSTSGPGGPMPTTTFRTLTSSAVHAADR